MTWAVQLAEWMERRDMHLSRPRMHKLLLWVLSPPDWGEHLGLRNWLIWAFRR